MSLVETWRRRGAEVSFADLADKPTIAAWAELLNSDRITGNRAISGQVQQSQPENLDTLANSIRQSEATCFRRETVSLLRAAFSSRS